MCLYFVVCVFPSSLSSVYVCLSVSLYPLYPSSLSLSLSLLYLLVGDYCQSIFLVLCFIFSLSVPLLPGVRDGTDLVSHPVIQTQERIQKEDLDGDEE